MKKAILFFTIVLILMAAGCAKDPSKEGGPKKPYVTAEPVEQSDGSTLTVAESENGIKSEVKFFPKGELAQISRASWPDGRRTATVKFRDGSAVDLQDRSEIDRVIEAPVEDVIASAKKAIAVTGGSKTAPVVSAEDVTKELDAKEQNAKEEQKKGESGKGVKKSKVAVAPSGK